MAINDIQNRQSGSSRVELGEALGDTDIIKMIVINTTDDEAYKATDAANVKVIGVNDSGERDHAEGDYIVVHRGCYLMTNSTSSPVLARHTGGLCYVEDADTVQIGTGSHSVVAGTVEEVNDDGVWVNIGVDSVVATGS